MHCLDTMARLNQAAVDKAATVQPSGHHPDGSGVQQHSAGTHYPYIVGKKEGREFPWFVMAPSGEVVATQREAQGAFDVAEFFAIARRQRTAA